MNKAFYFAIFITLFFAMLTNSDLLYRICVLSILLSCIKKGLNEPKLVNPFLLFSLAPLSLLIYSNVGPLYMVELTQQTWLLGIINMTAFLVGLDITKNTKNIKQCKGVGVDFSSLKIHALAMSIIGTIPYLYFIFTGLFFPLASIITLLAMPGLMCAFCTKNRMLIVVCLFIIMSPMVIGNTSKSTVLTIALASVIAYEKFYLRSEKDRKRVLLLGILGIILMIVSFSFANKDRGTYNAQEGISYYENNGVDWNYDAKLFLPYMYITTPWTNLQYVTETQNTRTNGLWSIKPILGYLQIDDRYEKEYTLTAYSSFNTFTFIAVHFKDFGYWGSILLSLFLGYFVRKVYSLFLISGSPLDIATYVYVAQAVLEMFFSNHFFGLSYPFTIVILMWAYKTIICRKAPVQLDHSFYNQPK